MNARKRLASERLQVTRRPIVAQPFVSHRCDIRGFHGFCSRASKKKKIKWWRQLKTRQQKRGVAYSTTRTGLRAGKSFLTSVRDDFLAKAERKKNKIDQGKGGETDLWRKQLFRDRSKKKGRRPLKWPHRRAHRFVSLSLLSSNKAPFSRVKVKQRLETTHEGDSEGPPIASFLLLLKLHRSDYINVVIAKLCLQIHVQRGVFVSFFHSCSRRGGWRGERQREGKGVLVTLP